MNYTSVKQRSSTKPLTSHNFLIWTKQNKKPNQNNDKRALNEASLKTLMKSTTMVCSPYMPEEYLGTRTVSPQHHLQDLLPAKHKEEIPKSAREREGGKDWGRGEGGREGERERERERDRERESERHTHTGRQKDRVRDRERERERDRQTGRMRQTEGQREF